MAAVIINVIQNSDHPKFTIKSPIVGMPLPYANTLLLSRSFVLGLTYHVRKSITAQPMEILCQKEHFNHLRFIGNERTDFAKR